MSEMSNSNNEDNGVNEIGTNSEGLSPGRCTMAQQHGPGRHPATARRTRRKWSHEENRVVMECFYNSNPKKIGYRKRMHNLWIVQGMFVITEQRLVDQKSQIIKKKWLSELELEAIRRSVDDAEYGQIGNVIGGTGRTMGDDEENQQADATANSNVTNRQGDEFTGEQLTNEYINEIHPDVEYDETSLTEEEKLLMEKIKDFGRQQRERLPPLKGVDSKKLKEVVNKVNAVLGKVQVKDITHVNDLMYGGAALVTEMVGMRREQKEKKEPWWRRRLEDQVRQLNKDLRRINNLIQQKKIKKKHQDFLQRKYKMKHKSLQTVREEIKQRIAAKTGKIKRYQQRINQFQQNRLFVNNEGKFYQNLNAEKEYQDSEAPEANDAINFWSDIWGKEAHHNKEAEWLENFRCEVRDIDQQSNITITHKEVKAMLKNFPNWKAPGPDGVQGYWLKNFVSLHSKLAEHLNLCLETGETPAWMTKGRTVLIQKDRSKGTVASNYRPITCLPLVWKLLTGIVANEVYSFLEGHNLLPEEQKGCRRNSKGTADLLFIDKMILKEVKSRKKNLAMGWVDYRKAYDMLPHSWIIECLVNLGINEKVQNLLKESMKKWKVELTCGKQELGEVNIKRGIFQGGCLITATICNCSNTPDQCAAKGKSRIQFCLKQGKDQPLTVYG